MSAIRLEALLISDMEPTASPTTWPPLFGDGAGLDGELVGLAGVVGVLLDGGGHLLHAGRRFFQAGRLLLGALRQVVVAGGHFARGLDDTLGRDLDLGDELRQVVDHVVHRRGQCADGILFLDRDAACQVALGDRHGRRPASPRS